ncbi:GNAT family N-acetyltransferase [Streptomyces lunaelactis]|uniref:GNAT family N-acetyltransferase n=1 Tax=Streptomyces lunaelactis TaxID=1535768 RepID=UPI00131F0E15|nr:GNAT family N-acetyltransferase [Streptomyces lunaelactis]NUK86757.1 GNAT family N-acetyltransferase [Streptomyces lunaelactis]
MSHHQAPESEPREWDVHTGDGVTRAVSPVPRETWAKVLAADPGATAFLLPQWLDCICSVRGWQDASRLYRTAEGRELVLPMVRRPAWFRALSLQSSFPPGWGTGGILASGGVRPDEVDMVLADLASDRALRTSVRPDFAAAPAWPGGAPGVVTVPRRVHVLDLDGGMDALWSQRWSGKSRRGLRSSERKAEQAGLVIESGHSPELVSAFYDLYLRWIDRRARERQLPSAVVRSRGKRAEPLAKFQAVAASLPGTCRIHVARLDGEPVAATISLLHGSICIYWRGVSDKRTAAPLRANQFLQLRSIKEACDAGCRYYEMGESGGVTSLEQFKANLGGGVRTLAEYRIERLPLTGLQDRLGRIRNAVDARLATRRS